MLEQGFSLRMDQPGSRKQPFRYSEHSVAQAPRDRSCKLSSPSNPGIALNTPVDEVAENVVSRMFELSRASSIILATAVSAVLAGQILWTTRRWRVGDFRSVESEYWRTSNLVIRAFIRLTYVSLVVLCTTVILGTAALWRIYYGPLARWIVGAVVIVTTVIYVSGSVLMVTITLWNWPRPLVPRPFRGERGLLG